MSNLYNLDKNDFIRGLITAVFAGIVWSIGSAVNQAGFDVFSANWGMILGSAFNAGIAAFMGYLSKNFLTGEDGKVNLGVAKV